MTAMKSVSVEIIGSSMFKIMKIIFCAFFCITMYGSQNIPLSLKKEILSAKKQAARLERISIDLDALDYKISKMLKEVCKMKKETEKVKFNRRE